MQSSVQIKNKKAYFEYHVLETFTAGIQLFGTEIKSIREAKVNLSDAFCAFSGNDLYVRHMHIAEYSHYSFYSHETKRERKLLLRKKELKKLKEKSQEKGLTIVPLQLFINKRGFAKLEIALARGKKLYDKREAIKERDSKIEMGRKLK